MNTKLFFMLALGIAMLTTSCGQGSANGNKGKAVATYNFSDGTVITKSGTSYTSNKGATVYQVNGNIIILRKANLETFKDPRLRVKMFSAVYNINRQDPILSFDEYYAGIDMYPKSGLIVAHKLDNNPGIGLYSLRTFDGQIVVFPRMDYKFHRWYTDATRDPITVNDATGEITTTGRLNKPYTFTLNDIKPEWVEGNLIHFDFDWYRDFTGVKPGGGEYIPFTYGGEQ